VYEVNGPAVSFRNVFRKLTAMPVTRSARRSLQERIPEVNGRAVHFRNVFLKLTAGLLVKPKHLANVFAK
jgi:hypothetical protein